MLLSARSRKLALQLLQVLIASEVITARGQGGDKVLQELLAELEMGKAMQPTMRTNLVQHGRAGCPTEPCLARRPVTDQSLDNGDARRRLLRTRGQGRSVAELAVHLLQAAWPL